MTHAPLDPEIIEQQFKLLATHRQTLAHQLTQRAAFDPGLVPSHLAAGILEARAAIARIKTMLRSAGVAVADHPDDVTPAHERAAPATLSTRLSREERENRRVMLGKVRSTWIAGVLHKSLWQEARLDLPLAAQPGAVQRPYHLVTRSTAGDELLPDGTRIADVYASHEGALLILGAPGAGKTTLLLELAAMLLDEATAALERGEVPTLPVVFNLASWAQGRLPLVDWLTRELNTQYQVSRPLAQRWVVEHTILPLLDGLDEVASDARAACASAINTYRQEHGGLRPLIVCCRAQEYDELGTALQLHGAVLALPLEREQIAHVLAEGGERLEGICAALAQDAALWELLKTPLMLSIVVLAYEGQAANALPSSGDAMLRRTLFGRYVARMLDRRADAPFYPRQEILRWLRWLAKQLGHHDQTVYQIEAMQADWLASTTQQRIYWRLSALTIGLLVGLMGGVCFGLAMGLLVGFRVGIGVGLVSGLSVGLSAGFLVRLDGGSNLPLAPVDQVQWSWEELRQRWWSVLPTGVGFGLVGGIFVGLFGGLVIGLGFGLIVGVGFGLSFGLRGGGYPTIAPVDQVQWSWQAFRQRWWSVLAIGLLLGVLSGLLVGVLSGLLVGVLSGLLGGLLSGLHIRFQSVNPDRRSQPNDGIRRSARSGLVGALIGGLGFGLVVGIGFGLVGGLGFGILVGVGGGVLIGIGGGLLFGWAAVLQHYTLRLFLWRSGVFPRDIAAFCDYCAERILLRRVGGGWIFIHRLLLEYFAELDDDVRER
jgi:eukaryotic-like serine/threonine-protein kinase